MANKKFIKASSVVLASAMVLGSLPVSASQVYAEESSGTSSEIQEEVNDAETVEKKAYALNASGLNAEEIAGGLDIGISSNTKIFDFFTLNGTGSKIKIHEHSATETESTVTYGTNVFDRSVYLTGGLKANGQAGISFTIPEGKTAVVTYYAKAKSTGESVLAYVDKDGKLVKTADTLSYDECGKYTLEGLTAGTYTLGATNGGFFYYIEVKYVEQYQFSSADTDFVAGQTYTEDTAIGTDGFFTVMSKGGKNNSKALDSAYTFGGISYEKALQLGGKLNPSSGQAGIKISLEAPATIKILASAKSSSASNLVIAKTGSSLENATVLGALADKTIQDYTIENLPAGEYYIGGTNGGYIFDIFAEYVSTYEIDPNSSDFQELFPEPENNSATLAEDKVTKDGYFQLIATGSKTKLITEKNLSYKGVNYANAYRLDGAAKTTGQACFSITTDEVAKVTILAAGKNDKGSKFEYTDSQNVKFTEFGDPVVKDVIGEYTLEDLLPGTYYFGSTQGLDIYAIKVEYDANEEKAIAWDQVETPVINQVTVDEEGNFVVDFSALIDKIKGAEDVKITMFENGYEVSTQTLTSQADSVTFSPLWSGNYTFSIVAQRAGEADKAGETYAYPEYYTLAVHAPVITWAQNKGEGSVYVDWVNIEEADSYVVSVKEANEEDYREVATLSASQCDYTITGLTAGTDVTVKVSAVRSSDGYVRSTTKDITVTAQEEQAWFVATTGSAQATDAVITDEEGNQSSYHLNSSDTIAVSAKSNNVEAVSVANTDGSISFAPQSSGKISDDEDGFSYYYTKIDPDTENFTMTATFEITDVSLTPDNQTGFGLIAADMLGINNWGAPTYVHKYFNYTSAMVFSSSKNSNPMFRTVTGYESADASNCDGAERSVDNKKFSNLTENSSTWFALGSTYTFTLSKTDSGYSATVTSAYGTQTMDLTDNAFTSVQEDGTVCIGVFASRKVGVNVTNISFEKSASNGITSSSKGEDVINPAKGTVYSSNTTGADVYEFTYVPVCDGTLTVKANDGSVAAADVSVAKDEVVRVEVPVTDGNNTISYTFVPAYAANLTSTNAVNGSVSVEKKTYHTNTVTANEEDYAEYDTLVVSPNGTAAGNGTEESPLDLATAVKYAAPGQTILLKDGVYSGATIQRSVSGTPDKHITMVAENLSTDGKTNGVIFTGTLNVVGSYWDIYGIYVYYPAGVGIQICGNYNTIEMCTVEGATNTGIQISRSGSADNYAGRTGLLWPSYNLVKNCESFDNCDSGRNDADGFAAKLTSGEGNKFYGCIGHNNVDDGWDLYAKTVSGEIGKVVIENCVAYNNGWLTYEDPAVVGYGEGNGFKLGGGYLKGGHQLINSVTFDNAGKGITSNSCPDCQVINCTSYNNSLSGGNYNVGLNTRDSNVKAWVVTGLISMNSKNNTELEDLIIFSLHNPTNYIYNGSSSFNSNGVEATTKWFENVNTAVLPTRNADGSINMNGLLVANDSCPSDAGARLDTTSSQAVSVKPEYKAIASIAVDEEEPEVPEVTEIVTDLATWVSGDFSVNNGKVSENATRIRTLEALDLAAGRYTVSLANNSMSLVIREFNENGKIVNSIYCSNNSILTVVEGHQYFAVLYGLKDADFSKYVEAFENGFSIGFTLNEEATEIVGAMGTWISGNYSSNTGKYSANVARICLNEEWIVEAGHEYEVSIPDSTYSMLVREINENGKYTGSVTLKNGSHFTAEEGMHYYVTLYKTKGTATFADYIALFESGFDVVVTDVTVVEEEVEETEVTEEETEEETEKVTEEVTEEVISEDTMETEENEGIKETNDSEKVEITEESEVTPENEATSETEGSESVEESTDMIQE